MNRNIKNINAKNIYRNVWFLYKAVVSLLHNKKEQTIQPFRITVNREDMKRKLALQEVADARYDFREQLINMVELKAIIANVSELSGIGYDELLSETAD